MQRMAKGANTRRKTYAVLIGPKQTGQRNMAPTTRELLASLSVGFKAFDYLPIYSGCRVTAIVYHVHRRGDLGDGTAHKRGSLRSLLRSDIHDNHKPF